MFNRKGCHNSGEPITRVPELKRHVRNSGRLPFTKNSRKFRLGSKWKTIFWFVSLENSGTNGNSEKVVPFSRLGRSELKFVYHLQLS